MSKERTLTLLAKLSDAHGASGFEKPVEEILREEWKSLLMGLHVDGMGNLIGSLPNATERPRVLFLAHMDELGWIVREISDEGFIYVDPLGAWLDPVTAAQRWVIMTPHKPVIGYTGIESIHSTGLMGETASLLPPTKKKLFIDIGAKSRHEVEKAGVRIGLPVTPDARFTPLLGGDRFLGKAFDDRALLAILTQMLEHISQEELKIHLSVAATVQEELGMRGATVVAAQTTPDLVFNLDTIYVRDFPEYYSSGSKHPKLGCGPTLVVYDHSMIAPPRLVEFVIEVAQTLGIPYQLASADYSGYDAASIQRTGYGVPALTIALPCRYVHSHSSIIDRSDYEHLLKLITAISTRLNKERIQQIVV